MGFLAGPACSANNSDDIDNNSENNSANNSANTSDDSANNSVLIIVMMIVIIIVIYKDSAWVAGAHASDRAGQHFDKSRCSCPIWHSLNFKVMPRV